MIPKTLFLATERRRQTMNGTFLLDIETEINHSDFIHEKDARVS